MFKFNFTSTNNAETIKGEEVEIKMKSEDITWIDAKEVPFQIENLYEPYLKEHPSILLSALIGETKIKYLSSTEIVHLIGSSNNLIFKTEQDHSDVITAFYEGGLKIWNGTFDLLDYLNKQKIDFSKMNVLDLGCGNGLLGIYTMLNGASVTFQDYNEEVVKYITIPNVDINCTNAAEKCQFYCGDWASFVNKMPKNHFDYILTSDTIYNSDNYEKLHSVFESLLKKSGKIYLSAKTLYFGLSGSIPKFQALLNEKGTFTSTSESSIMEGIQREILEMKFR